MPVRWSVPVDAVTNGILIAEDDPAIRALLVDLLTDEGFAVRAAGDGEEALAVLDGWRPALIILDQLMPRMDGASFRAAQRERPEIAAIPVLLLSAARDLPERGQLLDVAAILPKPFDLDRLISLAGQLIAAADSPQRDTAELSDREPVREDAWREQTRDEVSID